MSCDKQTSQDSTLQQNEAEGERKVMLPLLGLSLLRIRTLALGHNVTRLCLPHAQPKSTVCTLFGSLLQQQTV